jgi:hypothetical protein
MAHPFRKTTTRQLRKLLQDEQERNRNLTEAPDRSDTDLPTYHSIRIQPIPPQQTEISTESR